MFYEEENGVAMTSSTRNSRRYAEPPPKPDPRITPHRRKQSSIASSVLIGIFAAVFLICATAALLARADVSLPSLGFHISASTAGVREERIREAVEGYLLSSENPMRSLNAGSNYHIKRSEKDQGIVLLTITVAQETERTYYECDLQTKWKRDGTDYSLIYLDTDPDVVCYPLNAPGKEAESLLTRRLEKKYPNAQFQIDFSRWHEQNSSFSAGVFITQPQLAYIEEQSAEMTMHWSVPDEAWQADGQTFRILEQAVDFSPLNGTWIGVYSHPSTYLRKSDIPFSITFSNAGKVKLDSIGEVNAPVTVQHILNELWNTYQTDNYNVNYESGKMSIHETGYGYYQIEFEETNVEGIFEHPCKVKIYSDAICFEDALVAKSAYLHK